MRAWLKEPLLHFVALGLALFALYTWAQGGSGVGGEEIVVDRAQIAALVDQHERLWQRPPTPQELDGLVENWVREQVLYREGLAAGLDRDDAIVRRRVVQKMTFVAEGLATEIPEDAELEAWFVERADDYRLDAEYSLRQVFFDPGRHGEDLEDVVTQARATLEADPDAKVGDATLLPARLGSASEREVQRNFGVAFAEALVELPVGTWAGPVASGFGVHLVRIEDRVPARLPELSEVRKIVERDLMRERTQEAIERFYRAARERYRVRVEPKAGESDAQVADADARAERDS